MGLKLLLIATGGALGSVVRYLLSGFAARTTGVTFPVGTLAVNLLGCFLIGFLNAAFLGKLMIREEYRQGILIGVLGGLTTFSSFGWETVALAGDRQWQAATFNVVLTNIGCLLMVWLGYRLGDAWFRL